MSNEINRLKLAQFGNLELLAKQVVEGFITGMHKSPFHGFSVEFAEHRLYNAGESTRHIDWKLYARRGKFFTKKYEEERAPIPVATRAPTRTKTKTPRR